MNWVVGQKTTEIGIILLMDKFSLARSLLVFLGSAVGIVKGLAVAVKPARLTVEARFNLAHLFAVLGGFKVVVPFGPSSAFDFTDLAELIVLEFARVGAVLEGHTVGF